MVRVGTGAFLALGEIATWDAAVTAASTTKYFRTTSGFDALQMEKDIIHLDDISAMDRAEAMTVGSLERITGNLEVYPTYQDLPFLLRQITGDHGVDSGAGDPYTHILDMVQAGDTGTHGYYLGNKFLVAEICRSANDANSIFYHPFRVVGATFNFEAGAFLTISLDCLGKQYTSATKSAATAYGADQVALPTDQTEDFITIHGTTYVCRSATLNISKPHEERRDIVEHNTREPLPSDWRDITLDVEIEVDDDSLLTSLIAGACLSGATNRLLIKKSAGDQFQVDFGGLYLQAPVEGRASGFGPTLASFSMKVVETSALPSVRFTVTNDQATP